jgi:hypothetical protein
MLAVDGDMYGVYTFSPKNPSVDQLGKVLTQLKKAPKKVFSSGYKKLSAFTNGSIRFIGMTYSCYNGFHAHLHVIFHCTHTLTKIEAKNLYDLLNKRFKKCMGLHIAETHMGLYANTFENLKRTASYITKYADHKNLSYNLAYMDTKTYEIYQESYTKLREFEFAGCYRSKTASHPQYTPGDIKKLLKAIHCNGNPKKLYEFKSTQEVSEDIDDGEFVL